MRRRSEGEPPLPPRVRRVFRLPFFTAARVARDVDEEVAFHLEMRAAELRASGLTTEEAAAEARRRFGDAEELRRSAVAASLGARVLGRVREWVTGWRQDLGFALRQIARAPGFAVVAVVVLALGIGASTAIFSVVDHLLLDPLPFRDGNRMVGLWETDSSNAQVFWPPDRALIVAWRARARTLTAITTYRTHALAIGRGAGAERGYGAEVDANLFRFLGVRPVLGRTFAPSEARAGAYPSVIISYALWKQRFGGRADVLGRTLAVDSVTRTIVGVAPRGLAIPFASDVPPLVWTPLPTALPDSARVIAIGKLRPGIPEAAATKELATIAGSLASDRALLPNPSARARREQDFLGARYRRGVLMIFLAVGIVLLIACANVATLLLVRAWRRRREFAIRTALGAGRARLARQVLTESMMLALIAGLLGLFVAWGGVRFIIVRHPDALRGLGRVRIDHAVLAWACGVSLLTGLVFGTAPAIFAGGRGLGDALRAGARGATGSTASRCARGAFVITEIALSVVLLVGGGLLLRSFSALERVPLGYDPHGLVSVDLAMPPNRATARRNAAFGRALALVRGMHGVSGAVLATGLPPGGAMMDGRFVRRRGVAPNAPPAFAIAGEDFVQPGFFHLLHIPLRGRSFSGDTTGLAASPPNEVVLSEKAAHRLFPSRDALGTRIRFGPTNPWLTVVGIAGNVTVPGRRGDLFAVQLYSPARSPFPDESVILRSTVPIETLAPAIRRALSGVDPALAVRRIRTADSQLRAQLAGPRFATWLVGAFALAALLMSAVGLYGVVAYALTLRTRELGVRVALGARPTDVARIVVAEGAVLALAGTVLGLGTAALAARAIRSFLFGVGSGDPLTYAAVVALLAGVVLVASWLPARRAMRVDPVVALAAD